MRLCVNTGAIASSEGVHEKTQSRKEIPNWNDLELSGIQTLQLPDHFVLRQHLCKTPVSKKDDGFGHRFVEVDDVELLAGDVHLHLEKESSADSLPAVVAPNRKLSEATGGKDYIPNALVTIERSENSLHLQSAFDRIE